MTLARAWLVLALSLVTLGLAHLGPVLAGEVSAADRSAAKQALISVLRSYQPGAAITDALKATVDDAAQALEATQDGPVNLSANPDVNGIWVTLFSSQGILGTVDVSFMTRTLPGGGTSGGKANIQSVSQELQPDQRFYRNMMVMTAGEKETPILYVATADLGIAADKADDLEVLFHTIAFVPGGAGVTLADVRDALSLGSETPLSINIPLSPQRKPSRSTVTYLDNDLRINRGKTYIAIMQKVQ